MKVGNAMQKKVVSVTVKTPVKEIARIIFGSRINGVPVLKDRKVVGFITERDILSKFYPSMEEYVDDPVHARDFEGMEKKLKEILRYPAEKIMSKNPTTIKGDAPLLRAYSLMTARKIGRLPVVDDDDKLIGIISKGDIFNYLVGSNIPLGAEAEFYDWATQFFDNYIDWKARLTVEIPDIEKILRKEGLQTVLDIASSTGEHAIALAKKGFQIYGIETSTLMHKISEQKKSKLPKNISERISFLKGMYKDTMKNLPANIDAALFLGNAFPHVLYTEPNILKNITKVLDPKKAVIIFQMANFKLKLNKYNGFRSFVVRDINDIRTEKQAYLNFYSREKNELQSIIAVFDNIAGKWMLQGINGTPIRDVDLEAMKEMLKEIGFNHVTAYGSDINKPLLNGEFDESKDGWITIVARR